MSRIRNLCAKGLIFEGGKAPSGSYREVYGLTVLYSSSRLRKYIVVSTSPLPVLLSRGMPMLFSSKCSTPFVNLAGDGVRGVQQKFLWTSALLSPGGN